MMFNVDPRETVVLVGTIHDWYKEFLQQGIDSCDISPDHNAIR